MDELLDLADELKSLRGQLQGLIKEAKLGMSFGLYYINFFFSIYCPSFIVIFKYPSATNFEFF